jgi:hypothetical protein
MRQSLDRWRPYLRRYRRRLPLAAGVGLIVGAGMAAFAPLFYQSPLVLGPIAGIGIFVIILHYEWVNWFKRPARTDLGF